MIGRLIRRTHGPIGLSTPTTKKPVISEETTGVLYCWFHPKGRAVVRLAGLNGGRDLQRWLWPIPFCPFRRGDLPRVNLATNVRELLREVNCVDAAVFMQRGQEVPNLDLVVAIDAKTLRMDIHGIANRIQCLCRSFVAVANWFDRQCPRGVQHFLRDIGQAINTEELGNLLFDRDVEGTVVTQHPKID